MGAKYALMFLLELFRSQSEVGCEGTKDECRAEALNHLVKIRRLCDWRA